VAFNYPTFQSDIDKYIASETVGTQAVVCFTFDDAYATDISVVKPVLDTAGIKAGFAIPSGFPTPTAGTYMTWAQVLSLQTAGHEILAHSVDHSHLGTFGSLTSAQTLAQINNQAAYTTQGITKPRGLVYPFGENDSGQRQTVRKYYDYALALNDNSASGTQNPLWTYAIRRILLNNTTVTADHTAQIDKAIANNEILIFMAHSGDGTFTSAGGATARLAAVIAYAQSKSVPIVTPSQAYDMTRNVIDAGDYPGKSNYTVVSSVGQGFMGGSKTVVDIRDYLTGGTNSTFDLAAVVAAMELYGGACYVPPGNWTAAAVNIALDDTLVSTAVWGGSAKTRFTYKFFGSGKSSKVILPATMGSGDYLMIANSTNTANFGTHPKVIFEDIAFAGAATGGVGNLILLNQRSINTRRTYLSNMVNGIVTTGYADVCRFDTFYSENMTAGGWAISGTTNGDGWIFDQVFTNGTGGINLRGCLGASVRGCVGGYHQFKFCHVSFEANHFEGDQYVGPIPTILLQACVADFRSGFYQAKKYRPTFVINDLVSGFNYPGRYTFGENVWFGQRLDDPVSTYGPAKAVDIDIFNLSNMTEIVFHSCRSYPFYQSQSLGNSGGAIALMMPPLVTASGIATLQTALTAAPLRPGTESTIRYVGSGNWEIAPTNRLPIPTKAIAATFLSATATTMTQANAVTDLTAGTYYYKAWVVDIAGRATSPSTEASVTITSAQIPQLGYNSADAPVRLRLLRGTAAGTYTKYIEVPISELAELFWDQGSYMSGYQWQNWTGTPAVPTASETQNGLLYTETGNAEIRAAAAPTAGAWLKGDRCWNTDPVATKVLGWECTVAGTPGTWVSMNTLSIARTVQTVTSAVTLAATGDYIVFIGAAGVVTLPTAVGNTSMYTLKNADTVSKNIATTASQTIEKAAAPFVLAPATSIDLVSDGANWRLI
jgi:peptidoglycan/xylan/chitin deacetylase (PgdA/CDA1 family)